MKSVHRGSVSNSRPYDIIMLYKCALRNDEYASHHSLDIGGSTYTRFFLVVISDKKTGGQLICRLTYMKVYTVSENENTDVLNTWYQSVCLPFQPVIDQQVLAVCLHCYQLLLLATTFRTNNLTHQNIQSLRNLEKCARYKCICQKAAQVQDNSKVLSVQGSTRRSVMLISSQICMESDPCLTQCATAWAIMFIFLDKHLRNFCLHQSFYIFLKYFNLDLI